MSEYIIDTYENGIYKAEILPDSDPIPFQENEDGEHFRFITNVPRELSSKGWGKADRNLDLSDFENAKAIRARLGKGWSLYPVYAYIHSGITIRLGSPFSCRWDSGLGGILCVNGPALFNSKRSNLLVKESAQCFVTAWDQYLTGDICGFRVSINHGTEEDPQWEEVDSCQGFYGSDDAMKEAKSIIDSKMKTEFEAQAFEKIGMAI